MPPPIYITGPAGTGKTTKLLERTAVYAQELVTLPHQQLLAMAYMHGARRRLDSSLAEHSECKNIPRTVSTVDSFALSLLNRWRSAVGIGVPVCAAPSQCLQRFERHDRLHLPFEDIMSYAAGLLSNSLVARIVGASYPLIVIDEFQDCAGSKLDFIKALSIYSQLIVAADSFQFLNTESPGCPAVEWIEGLIQNGLKEHHSLTEPWRFTNRSIFSAATAVRESRQNVKPEITTYYGPAIPTAWRIMERLLLGWYGARWTGTTALICPSGGGIVDDVLRALNDQIKKRSLNPIRWVRQTTSQDEQNTLFDALTVTDDHLDESEWQPLPNCTNPFAVETADRASRFAHLRGLGRIPKHLISSVAEQVIHNSRAYSRTSSRFVVTTIHAAKNCQFDNVFVLWSYQIPPDKELQRRLLYNAITRSKKNCIVFDTRKKEVATKDSVITLLGTPQPTFEAKERSKSKKKSKAAGASSRKN
jgi:superfamily I DNA/RNA helicase